MSGEDVYDTLQYNPQLAGYCAICLPLPVAEI